MILPETSNVFSISFRNKGVEQTMTIIIIHNLINSYQFCYNTLYLFAII